MKERNFPRRKRTRKSLNYHEKKKNAQVSQLSRFFSRKKKQSPASRRGKNLHIIPKTSLDRLSGDA